MAYRPSRRVAITALIILVLAGACLAILPEVARRLAIQRLQAALTVPVSIADIDINLFTGQAAVERLVIGNGDSGPVLTLPLLSMEFSRWGLLAGRINLQSVVAQGPRFILERLGSNTYNIIEALRWPAKSEKASSDGVSFGIERLEIHRGEIVFVDHTQEPDYQVTFSSVDLGAGPIATLPETKVTPTDFTAGLEIAGGTIRFSGSTTPFGEDLQTQVTAEIANVRLETFNVYLPYGGRLNLDETLLGGQARYVRASRAGKPEEHYLDATLEIGKVVLFSQETSQRILELSGVGARGIHLDLLQNQGRIGALAIDQPYVLLKRDSSGLNLQQFLPESATARDAEEDSTKRLQIPLVIEHVEATGGTVEFIDETVSPAVEALFPSVRLTAEDMAVLPSFAVAKITAEAQAPKGSVQLTGALGNEPFKGRFSLVADGVPFAPYRGYLDQLFSSANSSGDYLNGKLQLLFSPGESGELATSISGHLEGYAMSLGFPDKEKPFLAAERLDVDLRTIQLGSNPRVDIDRIAFFGADLTVLRSKDGTLNVSRLWRSDEEESTRAPQQENNPATTVAIRAITVEKSMIEIFDTSVSPNYTTTVTDLKGKLWNLVPSAKRAPVELQGILGKSSELMLSGWFTPFTEKPAMHLEGTVRSYALPPLNPYATQYISHRIREGQISTDVSYTLNGDELEASADIVLRDVRVGEKTGDEFESRIGIPLELAIALLEDINGVIRLQVGMSAGTGFQLDVGSLIWNAVQNAIIRAITAPFRLIGRILTFGGRIGEITIEPLVFQPGTRELQTESVKQLAEIAELLKQKPQLELELNGKTSQQDIEALRKNEFWKRLVATGERGYEQALISVYREMGGITRPVTPLKPIAKESLERFVMERIEISEQELQRLALDRAETVKTELQKRGIDPERLLARAGQDFARGENPAVDIELIS